MWYFCVRGLIYCGCHSNKPRLLWLAADRAAYKWGEVDKLAAIRFVRARTIQIRARILSCA